MERDIVALSRQLDAAEPIRVEMPAHLVYLLVHELAGVVTSPRTGAGVADILRNFAGSLGGKLPPLPAADVARALAAPERGMYLLPLKTVQTHELVRRDTVASMLGNLLKNLVVARNDLQAGNLADVWERLESLRVSIGETAAGPGGTTAAMPPDEWLFEFQKAAWGGGADAAADSESVDQLAARLSMSEVVRVLDGVLEFCEEFAGDDPMADVAGRIVPIRDALVDAVERDVPWIVARRDDTEGQA